MRSGGVLQLATVVVAMAVTGHLLMHLQPHAHSGTADHHVAAAHAATSSNLSAAHATTPDRDSGAHLKAALCMAVLAAAALAAVIRLSVRGTTSVVVHRAALRHRFRQRLRAPPPALSRIDAGVLLRV